MKMLADLKVGKPDGAFIFPGDCNGFIDPDKFDLKVWKPIAEKAGKAGTRFHDLRHFFASQLIAQVRPPRPTRLATPALKLPSIRMGISSQAAARKLAPATRSRWPMRRFATKRRQVSNPLAIDGEEGPEETLTN